MRISAILQRVTAVTGLFLSAHATGQTDADAFIQQSVTGMKLQQAVNESTWKMSDAVNWNIDQERGEIVFSFADGSTATAPVQVVGTFNPKNQTFMWGWDHPSIVPALRRAASSTLNWALSNNLERWTKRTINCTEEDAWNFTAVAARLDGASGAYRAPSAGPLVYVVFGKVTIRPSATR